MRDIHRLVTAAAVMAVAVASCSPAPPARPPPDAASAAAPLASHVIDVYEPDDPGSYGQIVRFAEATGVQPGLVV